MSQRIHLSPDLDLIGVRHRAVTSRGTCLREDTNPELVEDETFDTSGTHYSYTVDTDITGNLVKRICADCKSLLTPLVSVPELQWSRSKLIWSPFLKEFLGRRK